MGTHVTPDLAVPARPWILTEERKLIAAASLGTIFEWYDFYLYGALAVTISRQFFSALEETAAFLFALLAFAAGFVVRPLGAMFFGRIGDLVGRKHTFLATMLLMGTATLMVGVLPGYSRIGIAAPIALISLRMLQGLAVGGEYGGAAVYIAEQAPPEKRGYYTGWIQTTATLGLLLSMVVVLLCRKATGDAFETWGWRIPFWFSIVVLGISMWIRLSMRESPVYLEAKRKGKLSRAPLREVFGCKENIGKLLVALGGLVVGSTVIWYTGQVYALYFLTQSLHLDPLTANVLLGSALLLASPFFVVFGWLSDRIGRKPVILAGLLLAAITVVPVFRGLTHYANPQLENAARTNPVIVSSDPSTCGFQFDPIGKRDNHSDCDKVKALLSKMGVPYANERLPNGAPLEILVGSIVLKGFDAVAIQNTLDEAGYPVRADSAQANLGMVLALLFLMVLLSTMTYGPQAAAMVECFPTRIRYTALSIPYHIGVGWFGGLTPAIGFSLVVATGSLYSGLLYSVSMASISFIIGLLFVRETKGSDISS